MYEYGTWNSASQSEILRLRGIRFEVAQYIRDEYGAGALDSAVLRISSKQKRLHGKNGKKAGFKKSNNGSLARISQED